MNPPFIVGSVGYARKTARPFVQNFADPTQTHKPLDPTDVRISDARAVRQHLRLDEQGFMLLDHKSSFARRLSDDGMQDAYVREISDLVTGLVSDADLILPCGDLMVRYSLNAPTHLRRSIGRIAGIKPSNDVHMDFSTTSFRDNAARTLATAGLGDRTYSRVAAIQTWRALSEPPHDFPLALTDRRTVKPGQYVLMHNVTDQQGSTTETRMALRDDDHAWYYFSDLRADELVVFKGFDGAAPETFNLFHAAFDDTRSQPDANARSSVEMRFLAYWT